MGELAEMTINGLLCQECGGYLEDFEEPGYPRTCEDCLAYEKNKKRPTKDCTPS
ncbi:hypothetical protein [Carnobacterium divergens]|uniref:hypothetical protein n=1 Tax=Carnobacterium divergens TaxID=2748 RepID=UPI000D4E931B|nr:hypothetical protein [Carnobacterium divergens]MCO6019364.1 hypothetical protein [Carnobacterium divergens]SPC40312.1 conserved hypothetical protein [Carnobacterium divergens]